jgi:hypothetical protein
VEVPSTKKTVPVGVPPTDVTEAEIATVWLNVGEDGLAEKLVLVAIWSMMTETDEADEPVKV